MTDTPYSVPCSLQHVFLQILDTFLPLLLSGQRTGGGRPGYQTDFGNRVTKIGNRVTKNW